MFGFGESSEMRFLGENDKGVKGQREKLTEIEKIAVIHLKGEGRGVSFL